MRKSPFPALAGSRQRRENYAFAIGKIRALEKSLITQEVFAEAIGSRLDDALRLSRLLKGMKCKVNTIAYNNIRIKGHTNPSRAEIRNFIKALRDNRINVTHRKSRGEDIDAGCGQLRISRL